MEKTKIARIILRATFLAVLVWIESTWFVFVRFHQHEEPAQLFWGGLLPLALVLLFGVIAFVWSRVLAVPPKSKPGVGDLVLNIVSSLMVAGGFVLVYLWLRPIFVGFVIGLNYLTICTMLMTCGNHSILEWKQDHQLKGPPRFLDMVVMAWVA